MVNAGIGDEGDTLPEEKKDEIFAVCSICFC